MVAKLTEEEFAVLKAQIAETEYILLKDSDTLYERHPVEFTLYKRHPVGFARGFRYAAPFAAFLWAVIFYMCGLPILSGLVLAVTLIALLRRWL